MNRRVILPVLLLVAWSVMGCRTMGGGTPLARLDVQVTAEGVFKVDGRKTTLEKLAGKVKAAGAGPLTAITVEVPKDYATSTITDITRRLAAAGFKKIVFRGPRQAEAFVTEKPLGTSMRMSDPKGTKATRQGSKQASDQ
jgi:hypothetical protein